MSDEGPLTFATTEELFDELCRRFDCALFVAERAAPGDADENATEPVVWYDGSQAQTLGLAEFAKLRVAYVTNHLFDAYEGDDG